MLRSNIVQIILHSNLKRGILRRKKAINHINQKNFIETQMN